MEYLKPIRCRFCGEVRPLDSFVGKDDTHMCVDCRAKEQSDFDRFFCVDSFASWDEFHIVENSKIKRLLGWCFG